MGTEVNEMRYSIGQFAGLHHVSKKTLRYYKDIGLLEPAGLDPANGYAFYEEEQHLRMQHIQYLRRLRFSLEQIGLLLCTQPGEWADMIKGQLAIMRSEARLLAGIEHELHSLQGRIDEGQEPFRIPAAATEYQVDTFRLFAPVSIIGRGERVPYNRRVDKEARINHLISQFFGNDEASAIPNQAIPPVSFGLVCECEEDMSEGTYLLGVQVVSLDTVPEGLRSFILPAGRYVRVAFQAVDREDLTNRALEGAYTLLYNEWLPQSGYPRPPMLAVEVYREHHMEAPVHPGMELWQFLPDE
jgi:DNA-binding transcriptional MerR regulator